MKPIEEMTGVELREACAIEVMGVHIKKQRGSRKHLRDLVIPGGVNGIDYVAVEGEPELTVRDLIEAVPAYESSIEAAFQVVDAVHNRMEGTTIFQLIQLCPGSGDANEFTAHFRSLLGDYDYTGHGDSIPLAICRAALKAVRAK